MDLLKSLEWSLHTGADKANLRKKLNIAYEELLPTFVEHIDQVQWIVEEVTAMWNVMNSRGELSNAASAEDEKDDTLRERMDSIKTLLSKWAYFSWTAAVRETIDTDGFIARFE